MELTGLKSFKNAGGSVYSSIGSYDSSKTVGYKQINNLPKFENGTPGQQQSSTSSSTNNTSSTTQSTSNTSSSTGNTSGITPNTYALTNSVKSYFNSPAATAGANITAKVGPSSTGGKGVNWSGIGNVVTSGVQFAGDAINSFSVNETGEDVQQKYGTSQQNVGGIGYESQNMIDLNKEMDRVKSENTGNTLKTVGSGAALGAATGSIIPGLGTIAGGLIGAGVGLITGIFGGEARKREYRRLLAKQNSKINALQDSARFSAQTKAIQQMNAREYGNSESQYLYGAKEGKQPEVDPKTMLSKDKLLSITPNGYTIDNADSMVEPGETLFNTETGSMTQVPRLTSGKLHPGDIQPAKIGNAAVFTDRHKDPITGKSFAQAAIDGDDDPYNLLYRQKVLVNDKKNNKGLMKAKNGKLPGFKDSKNAEYGIDIDLLKNIPIYKRPEKEIITSPLDYMKRASKREVERFKDAVAPMIPDQNDPYTTNNKLTPTLATRNSSDDETIPNWFTSPLDNLPYYFNMASALGHGLFRDRRIFTPKTGIAAPQGLDRLDALRMNPYPVLLNNRAGEARTNRAIDMSGGLNAAQRTLARLAAQYNTQLNDAQALANMQIQNNQYISDAVKTRLAAESAYDQRVVAQNNLRDDIFMRGHAANQQMDMDDLTTFNTAWQQANKNRFNGNLYRWMMHQYAQENKANRKKKWII